VNLLLLLEGDQTEPRVYEKWLSHRIPALSRVANVAGLMKDGYVLVRGKGYPRIFSHIAGLLHDIDENPGKVNHFWICLDSDNDTFEDRYHEVERAIQEASRDRSIRETNPSLEIQIIVQHCCIETWFLGHDGFMIAAPFSPELEECKQFYDVSVNDPEDMGCPSGYVNRAGFHERYLKAMLKGPNSRSRYTKQRPGIVLERSYFEGLVSRCERTNHLPSFQRFLKALRSAEITYAKSI
jgi:hypothetical protein